MKNLLKLMFPSFSSLRVDELNKVRIGTPKNPGQFPWFPNTIDEKSDEEDEDYKPDDEMEDDMEEEPLEYFEEDETNPPPETPTTDHSDHSYCMNTQDAAVVLQADMRNFVKDYNKQVDELLSTPNIVDWYARPYMGDILAGIYSFQEPDPEFWPFMYNGETDPIEIQEIAQLLYQLYTLPPDYDKYKTVWKRMCEGWGASKSHWNAYLERHKSIIHEGRIFECWWDGYQHFPQASFSNAMKMLKTIVPNVGGSYINITEAAVDTIQNIVSNLLVTVDNMNQEPKGFVLRLASTLNSMGISASGSHDMQLQQVVAAAGDEDSEEIRNNEYLDDIRVQQLVYLFVKSFAENVVEIMLHHNSRIIVLRDVEDAVSSILRGRPLPVWDRARAKIMAFIRMRSAQNDAAERAYAPGGKGAKEAARSFERSRSNPTRSVM